MFQTQKPPACVAAEQLAFLTKRVQMQQTPEGGIAEKQPPRFAWLSCSGANMKKGDEVA